MPQVSDTSDSNLRHIEVCKLRRRNMDDQKLYDPLPMTRGILAEKKDGKRFLFSKAFVIVVSMRDSAGSRPRVSGKFPLKSDAFRIYYSPSMWTWTVRASLGPSRSTNRIDCQPPSNSLPSVTGMLSVAFMNNPARCACAFGLSSTGSSS